MGFVPGSPPMSVLRPKPPILWFQAGRLGRQGLRGSSLGHNGRWGVEQRLEVGKYCLRLAEHPVRQFCPGPAICLCKACCVMLSEELPL